MAHAGLCHLHVNAGHHSAFNSFVWPLAQPAAVPGHHHSIYFPVAVLHPASIAAEQ